MPSVERLLRWAAGDPGVWSAQPDEIAEWPLGPGRALTPMSRAVLPE